jgi:hypothetical protein
LGLRRQPARVVEGRPEGGCPHAFELICCELGDHPDLGNCEVSPGFQRIRGLCPITAGVAAHKKHVGLHCQPIGAA